MNRSKPLDFPGNLYLADHLNQRIREMDVSFRRTGVILSPDSGRTPMPDDSSPRK